METYTPFSFLTLEELANAITQIEQAELSFVLSGGQQTITIGSVSFAYASRDELSRIKATLVSAYNKRTAPGVSQYKITHLMR